MLITNQTFKFKVSNAYYNSLIILMRTLITYPLNRQRCTCKILRHFTPNTVISPEPTEMHVQNIEALDPEHGEGGGEM